MPTSRRHRRGAVAAVTALEVALVSGLMATLLTDSEVERSRQLVGTQLLSTFSADAGIHGLTLVNASALDFSTRSEGGAFIGRANVQRYDRMEPLVTRCVPSTEGPAVMGDGAANPGLVVRYRHTEVEPGFVSQELNTIPEQTGVTDVFCTVNASGAALAWALIARNRDGTGTVRLVPYQEVRVEGAPAFAEGAGAAVR